MCQDHTLNGNGCCPHIIKRIPFVFNACSCGLLTFLDTAKLAREKESTSKVGGPLEQDSVDSQIEDDLFLNCNQQRAESMKDEEERLIDEDDGQLDN
jgi:hypothetical protein